MDTFDIVIIGAGPGGYVGAIRASQLGMKVAVVEADKPGGVCLNWGCIPSKSLIHQAELFSHMSEVEKWGISVDRSKFSYEAVHAASRKAATTLAGGVSGLLKKNKVHYVNDRARLVSASEVALEKSKTSLKAKHIIIATGSRPREIPGFEFDETQILSSTGILSMTKLPKSMIIMGGGVIGIEFAYVLNSFGVDVHIVELLDNILPTEDKEFAGMVAKTLSKNGVVIDTSTRALSVSKSKTGVELSVEKQSSQQKIKADALLVAVGRAPNTENIGLEQIGVKTEKGYVQVGEYYETRVKNVYAIGDVVNATPLLAHVASKEGEIVAEHLAGEATIPRIDINGVPSVVYCEPQLASFGLSEDQAKEKKLNFGAYSFPYRGAGKSTAINAQEGVVKIIYDKATKEILGASIYGHDATELIHELLLARQSELLPEDIATMVHAHPTLSEAVMEAARGIEGWAVHI